MNPRSLIICLLVAASAAGGLAMDTSPQIIPLWPSTAPGETETFPAEADSTGPDGRQVAGKSVVRLANVSAPALMVYHPDPKIATGAAVVVCPGGGYNILALDLEGTEVAEWFNSIGVTAIVLKYRVPRRTTVSHVTPPLQDVQRAIGMIRAHAKTWQIDPQRIGVLGFSAGAHLAASVSNNFTTRSYAPIDKFDTVSCRPDFAVLVYPAYLTDKANPGVLRPDVQVNAETPPTFLTMAQDDRIGVDNPLTYYRELHLAGVPAEIHLYPSGGHGYGLRRTENPVTTWPDHAAAWMRASGWLERR